MTRTERPTARLVLDVGELEVHFTGGASAWLRSPDGRPLLIRGSAWPFRLHAELVGGAFVVRRHRAGGRVSDHADYSSLTMERWRNGKQEVASASARDRAVALALDALNGYVAAFPDVLADARAADLDAAIGRAEDEVAALEAKLSEQRDALAALRRERG